MSEHHQDTTTPLSAGDRIRTILAGRTGAVVKVYGDGSAAVLWDDGPEQGEGLAHERVPRRLLDRIGKTVDEAARRDGGNRV